MADPTEEGFDKSPTLKQFEKELARELNKVKRNAKLLTFVAFTVVAVFAYRSHQENLMWRAEITDILKSYKGE